MTHHNHHQLDDALTQLSQCLRFCEQCAAECIEKSDASFAHCIKLCLACAESCHLSLKLMSYNLNHSKEACRLCAQLCDDCAAECEKGQGDLMGHCAEACRKCAEVCRQIAAA